MHFAWPSCFAQLKKLEASRSDAARSKRLLSYWIACARNVRHCRRKSAATSDVSSRSWQRCRWMRSFGGAVMLRISVLESENVTRLRLEGKLAQAWVQEAEEAWSAATIGITKKQVIVELFDISYVDDLGKELLKKIHISGGKLVGS